MHVIQRCHGLPHTTIIAKPRHNTMKHVGEKVPYGLDSILTWDYAGELGGRATDSFLLCTYFLMLLTTVSFFLLVVCEPKFRVGSPLCTGIAGAVKVTQIFKQKLKIQHGCPLSSQGLHLSPQLQENRCSPGILTPESCYTASSSAANMNVCPLHSHRQPLHQMWLCLPSLVFISCWWQNTWLIAGDSSYPHARALKSLFAPTQPTSQCMSTGMCWAQLEAGGAVWFPLFTPTLASQTKMQGKDCQVEEVREAGAHLSNRICSDTSHPQASLLLLVVQGWFPSCQTNPDLHSVTYCTLCF